MYSSKIIDKIYGINLILLISILFISIPISLSPSFANPNAQGSTIVQVGEAQSLCEGNLDIKGSLILSALTLCLTGVLNKINELNQIGCEEIVCIYENTKAGVDTKICQDYSNYKRCVFIIGEGFAFFPFFDTWKNTFARILKDPTLFVTTGVINYARRLVQECINGKGNEVLSSSLFGGILTPVESYSCDSTIIKISAVTTAIVTSIDLYKRLTDLFSSSVSDINYCAKIFDEIEPELDEIIKSATNSEDDEEFEEL